MTFNMCTDYERHINLNTGVNDDDSDWVDHLELIDYSDSPVYGETLSSHGIDKRKELIEYCKGEDRYLSIDIISINKNTEETITEEIYTNF